MLHGNAVLRHPNAFAFFVFDLWVTRPTGKAVDVAGMVGNWRRGLLQVLYPRGWNYMAPSGKYGARFFPSNNSPYDCSAPGDADVPDPHYP